MIGWKTNYCDFEINVYSRNSFDVKVPLSTSAVTQYSRIWQNRTKVGDMHQVGQEPGFFVYLCWKAQCKQKVFVLQEWDELVCHGEIRDSVEALQILGKGIDCSWKVKIHYFNYRKSKLEICCFRQTGKKWPSNERVDGALVKLINVDVRLNELLPILHAVLFTQHENFHKHHNFFNFTRCEVHSEIDYCRLFRWIAEVNVKVD